MSGNRHDRYYDKFRFQIPSEQKKCQTVKLEFFWESFKHRHNGTMLYFIKSNMCT